MEIFAILAKLVGIHLQHHQLGLNIHSQTHTDSVLIDPPHTLNAFTLSICIQRIAQNQYVSQIIYKSVKQNDSGFKFYTSQYTHNLDKGCHILSYPILHSIRIGTGYIIMCMYKEPVEQLPSLLLFTCYHILSIHVIYIIQKISEYCNCIKDKRSELKYPNDKSVIAGINLKLWVLRCFWKLSCSTFLCVLYSVTDFTKIYSKMLEMKTCSRWVGLYKFCFSIHIRIIVK